MLKQHSILCYLVILVVLLLGSTVYADETSQFNPMIQQMHAHRAQVEAQLGLDPQYYRLPRATSYYDDLVDHYEQVLIMSDFIDKGIHANVS